MPSHLETSQFISIILGIADQPRYLESSRLKMRQLVLRATILSVEFIKRYIFPFRLCPF